MNQIELVIDSLLEQIKQLSKENAVLKANLIIAESELKKLEKESDNG